MKKATPNKEEQQSLTMTVLFKKMQKDDKKEVLLFHNLSDDTQFAEELISLTGKMSVLTLSVDGQQYDPIQAEFMNLQVDSKKTVYKFNVATEDKERINAIYPLAGTTVELLIQSHQMTIDEVK